MGKHKALLFASLALAACNFGVDESTIENVENSVRQGLASQGNVKQVEFARAGEGRMTGYALVELNDPPGVEARFTCTAERQGDGTTYDWECVPPAAE